MKKAKKPLTKLLAILLTFVLLFTAVQIPLTLSAEGLQNLLPNGTFDTDISGWKLQTSSWGEMAWDETDKAITLKKISASSGPEIYTEAVKVESGDRLYLNYDYKTSTSLTSTASSVYIYAYTDEFIANKGTAFLVPDSTNGKYKGEFVDTTTDWQTKQISYTMPEGYEYVQVVFALRGGVAINTVLSIDNVELYKVDEDYVLNEIRNSIANDDQAAFETWIADSMLGIENLDVQKYADYFSALKNKDEITKAVIQNVVDSFVITLPESIIPNGTFDSDISGWKLQTSNWGEMAWDETDKAITLKKISASSGPEIYTETVKVESGDRLYLNYDYKTSTPLTSTASSVYFYAYTDEFIANKGTAFLVPDSTNGKYKGEFVDTTTDWQTKQISYTMPEGYEYVQVVFALRGGVAINTVLSIDNVELYKVDENYVLNEIRNAIANDDQTVFEIWIGAVLWELVILIQINTLIILLR